MASTPETTIRVPADFEDEFPGASALATECTLNLAVTAWAVERIGTAILASHGLSSMAAFNVLSVLHGSAEPLLPSTLAARMVVTRATMTGVLDALERRGLVRRLAHEGDGRKRLVAITPKGARIIDAVLPHIHAVERDGFRVLSKAEKRELLRLLGKLQAHFPNVDPSRTAPG